MKTLTYPPTLYDIITCQGGWDLETPTLTLPNGYVRQAQNFEVSQVKGGGYRRSDGYERFDGQDAPSSATFSIVPFTSSTLTVGPVSPEAIFSLSGGTGTIIWIGQTEGQDYIVIVDSAGTFAPGDNVYDIAGNHFGFVASELVVPPSNEDLAIYTAVAADLLRAEIEKVPGSGAIRGVAVLTISGTDTVFAFRDNVGGTAVDIYKATSSGWTAVTLFNEVSFTAGTTQPAEGDTLTQGGVTAVIKRVVTETGSWTTGSAAGRLIIANPSGGNFAAGAATAPGSTMTLSGAQTAITLTAGGHYEFDTHNFFGQAATRRLYGCSGVQRAFEFDGTVYVPLNHNDALRFPTHICVHKEHLMLAVESSIIHSGPGVPYQINAAAGGAEIALGDTITNFIKQPGDAQTGALTTTTKSSVHMLYGTSALNWNLVGQNIGVMGIAFTGARMNQSYWLDDNGITNLRASQEYGNFTPATITNNISSYIREKRGFVVGSCVHREKSQYRLYFSDGSALYATLVNGRLFGLMPQQHAHIFSCFWDGPSNDNTIYAGGSDGYVYHMDVGTSFDGEDIDAYLVFNWNAIRSPRVLKRYRKASLEMQGTGYAEIQFGFNLSYGRSHIPQDLGRTYIPPATGAQFWDQFTWDAFFWDGSVVAPTECEMRGSGENVQVVVRSGSAHISTYTLNSIILHHTPRRGLR